MLDTHLEAIIKWGWIWIHQPWLSNITNTPEGHNGTSVEMHFGGSNQAKWQVQLEVVNLNAVDWKGDTTVAENIHW